MRWTVRESTFKRALVEQAALCGNEDVLDVGCGTGTLLLEVKERYPESKCTGVDGDPKIVSIGREKSERRRLAIQLDLAMSFDMPYEDESFDCVFSSLFFHHLAQRDKLHTLHEVSRVLRPGGQLHVADWGKPSSPLMRLAFFQVQLLDGFETTRDNVAGKLPELMAFAGFTSCLERRVFSTLYGSLSLYSASKSGIAGTVAS